MKKNTLKLLVLTAVTVLLLGLSVSAFALTAPKSCAVHKHASSTICGTINKSLFLNSGPGTRRYFKELGSFGSKPGESVHILAKAYDPNNEIWWIEVEYPTGTNNVGWTGYSRFEAESFNFNDVPTEIWY